MTATDLERVRQRLGLDVTELARLLGVSVEHGWQLLNQMRRVTPEIADAVRLLERDGQEGR